MFELTRDSPVPLVDQICERVTQLVRHGQLSAGTRLPSIRKLARQVSASPFTVVDAYDRLAAAKFREHECEFDAGFPTANEPAKQEADSGFAERARMLIKRGYKPKVAVELTLDEMEIEHGRNRTFMEKVRADAEDFLRKVGKGLI